MYRLTGRLFRLPSHIAFQDFCWVFKKAYNSTEMAPIAEFHHQGFISALCMSVVLDIWWTGLKIHWGDGEIKPSCQTLAVLARNSFTHSVKFWKGQIGLVWLSVLMKTYDKFNFHLVKTSISFILDIWFSMPSGAVNYMVGKTGMLKVGRPALDYKLGCASRQFIFLPEC